MCEMCGTGLAEIYLVLNIYKIIGIPLGMFLLFFSLPKAVEFITADVKCVFMPGFDHPIFMFSLGLCFITSSLIAWAVTWK